MRKLLASILLLAGVSGANAQSSPGWTYGFVPTAGQWNAAFAAKQDWLGAAPFLVTGGTMTGTLTLAPGTATVAPMDFQAGANLTAPVAGAKEYDGTAFYETPAASNRGVTSNYHFERLTSNYTLGNVNTAQKALNATTNGQITVPAATGYRFRLKYLITNTGTTTHQWQVLLGGTATLTSGTMSCVAVSSTSSAVAAASQGYTTTLGTAFTVTTASTSATENATIDCDGTVNVNAGGTLIPQVQLTAATGVAATMLAGSFFEMWAQGANVVVSVGNWN